MAPRSVLEQKRCSEGFFVQKGLVGVICNGNTASETTMRAAPIVLRVRLTFDELDACDLIFSPPTSVERSDCGTSPHNGRARPAHSRVHRSSCRDMPPSTRRPPAWIESDESYAFRFLLPAESFLPRLGPLVIQAALFSCQSIPAFSWSVDRPSHLRHKPDKVLKPNCLNHHFLRAPPYLC